MHPTSPALSHSHSHSHACAHANTRILVTNTCTGLLTFPSISSCSLSFSCPHRMLNTRSRSHPDADSQSTSAFAIEFTLISEFSYASNRVGTRFRSQQSASRSCKDHEGAAFFARYPQLSWCCVAWDIGVAWTRTVALFGLVRCPWSSGGVVPSASWRDSAIDGETVSVTQQTVAFSSDAELCASNRAAAGALKISTSSSRPATRFGRHWHEVPCRRMGGASCVFLARSTNDALAKLWDGLFVFPQDLGGDAISKPPHPVVNDATLGGLQVRLPHRGGSVLESFLVGGASAVAFHAGRWAEGRLEIWMTSNVAEDWGAAFQVFFSFDTKRLEISRVHE